LQRFAALLTLLGATAAVLPMLAGGAIFGADAKPRVVVSVAVTPAGTREAGDVVTAQGQIALTSMSWDSGGTHYSCSSAPYGWHAKLGA
jgi:hypothetical protein